MLANLIIVAIIGILVGVVVNLLADALPNRSRIPFPPRYADGSPRPPIAWLGITAFLFRKRAAPDGTKLRWRYPATELFTAGLMILTLLATSDDDKMTALQLTFWLIYMAIFALITVIDLEHRLILFIVIIPACVVAILDALTTGYGASLSEALIGGAVGFGVFFLMYLGGFLFIYVMAQTRGRSTSEVAFGYGDVMLITLSGLILGWQPLIPAMFLTVFLGALGAVAWLVGRWLTGNRYSLFTPLPYGQYIIIATVIMLLFSAEVTQFLRQPT
jgi:prepilin signal peptidase PulO-like enzyme (type II secretory pathway)